MSATVRTRVTRFEDGAESAESFDHVSAEEPLEIRIGGRAVSVTMRTPGDDLELAAGFLLTEALLAPNAAPLLRSEYPNIVNAAVPGVDSRALDRLNRHSFIASSCGLCGKASIEAVHQNFPPIEDDLRIPARLLPELMARLRDSQPQFEQTGGLHAAGLFDASGQLIAVKEDVGRHNAVDKVIGYALLRGLVPLHEHILLVSGRASFEIVQKALGARIPVVVAVSAPSSLAVSFAEASGQTLVAFLRGTRFNAYTHVERITE
jgi:FdhD protein